MILNNRPRTFSVDQSEGSQSNKFDQMFPLCLQVENEEIVHILEKSYDKKKHSQELSNCCFKSHHISMVQMYNRFRIQHHPQLQQPIISNFFNNHQFPDLMQIGKWCSNSQEKYQQCYIPPLPKDLKSILDSIYLTYGYIPNLERLLLFYPNYLSKHVKLFKRLFEQHHYQQITVYFIGICAAAEMGSTYIMSRMLKRFLVEGGSQQQWISKGKYPQKLKDLVRLCRKMGRCPWQIDYQYVEDIISKGVWSVKQLTFFSQVIAFTQEMSTVALAMGLIPQENIDALSLDQIQKFKEEYNQRTYETSPYEKLADILPNLLSQQSRKKSSKQLKKSFRKIQNQQSIEGYMKQIGNQLTKQELYKKINKLLQPLLPQFQQMQKRRDSNNPPFDYSEFNFPIHVYPILNGLTPETVDLWSDLINYSTDMTLNNFGNNFLENKNTKGFRKALQYYSQNLCGYTHMEYNFKENIKQYLTMPLKFYTRLLTLSPLHITKQVLTGLQHEEGQKIGCLDLGHLAILISNTKMNFSLLMVVQNFNT